MVSYSLDLLQTFHSEVNSEEHDFLRTGKSVSCMGVNNSDSVGTLLFAL